MTKDNDELYDVHVHNGTKARQGVAHAGGTRWLNPGQYADLQMTEKQVRKTQRIARLTARVEGAKIVPEDSDVLHRELVAANQSNREQLGRIADLEKQLGDAQDRIAELEGQLQTASDSLAVYQSQDGTLTEDGTVTTEDTETTEVPLPEARKNGSKWSVYDHEGNELMQGLTKAQADEFNEMDAESRAAFLGQAD